MALLLLFIAQKNLHDYFLLLYLRKSFRNFVILLCMMDKSEITQLLHRLRDGENGVYDELYPLVYDELRGLAYSHLSGQWEHTLSKTELVHEVYLKMIDQSDAEFEDRSHFFGIASRCMRQILIDYARKKKAEKRGGDQKDLTYIDELYKVQKQKADELIGIDEALNRLEQIDERLSHVVEMRFFGKMRVKDIAGVLDVSESTVNRDWRKARGWLFKELEGRFSI